MRLLALALSLLASCGLGPIVTEDELDHDLAQNSHDDQSFAAVEDAKIVAAARADGVPMAGYSPGSAAAAPPPYQPSTDWDGIIIAAISALLGTGGAVGLRALDHRRKRRTKTATAT